MFHLGMLTLPITTHQSAGSWRSREYPFAPTTFDRPALWQHVAQLGEAACFDYVFTADTEGIFAEYAGSRDATLREGIKVPAFDQTVLAGVMAAATEHIGVVATVSTNSAHPWVTARRLASLDHMTGGRMGWNVVTGSHSGAMKTFGVDELLDHDQRYDRAEEYLQLCQQLWQGWSPEAIVADRDAGTYIDPAGVADIHFDGKWFKCDGPLNVHRSPQGGALIAQAGASPRGTRFAGKYADLVFAIQPFEAGMIKYYRQLKDAAADAGRDPDSCKIMFAFHAFVGESEAEAQEKAARHDELVGTIPALVGASGIVGYDLSTADPDARLLDIDAQGATGILHGAAAKNPDLTLAEFAKMTGRGAGPRVIGTASQVADWMGDTMASVGGDGFVYGPLYIPYDLEEFTRSVVPILQRRGHTRSSYLDGTLRDNLLAF